jgi:hypothetical protein
MKDYYKILNIGRHASDQEVKKAYRELALKFHPDKSEFENAHQRFTEINEAYQTLGRKTSRENYNFIFDYEKFNKSRVWTESNFTTVSDWGEEVRRKAKENARPVYAKNDDDDIDLRPYVKSVRAVSILSFLFTFLVILDYFLPKSSYDQTVLTKLNTLKSTNTIVIATEDFQFPLSYSYSKLIHSGDKAVISLSPIFRIQYNLAVDTGIDSYIFKPHYSIYNVFSFFLIILLATSYIGIFQRKENPELIFSAGVANVFLSLLVMYLIYI